MKRALLFLSLASLMLSGCAALSKLFASTFQKPTLQFQSVELTHASLSEATLQLHYVLKNPNRLGLSLAEVDYALFVDGKQVVAGKPPRGLQIPAQGQARLTFPAHLKFADLAPVVQTFLTQDYATYRAQGQIGVQTPLGVLRFPVAREDRFEVPKIPQVQLSAPRIAQLSLTGATLEIPVTVTNRNSYPLPLGGVGGTLSIAGAPVGSLSTGSLGALEGKAARSVTLPIQVHFLSAAAVAHAVRTGSGVVAFQGQVESGGLSLPVQFSQPFSFVR